MTEIATQGDLMRQMVLRRQTADVRAALDERVAEIGSGRKADLPGALKGDFSMLASVERDLRALSAFDTSATELGTRATTTQTVLGQMQTLMEDIAPRLLQAPSTGLASFSEGLAVDARQRLDAMVSALNTTLGGRTLFAGADTLGPALAPADEMFAAIEAAVAASGAVEPVDIVAQVDAWFAPGGGFEAMGYLGSADPIAPQDVGSSRRLGLSVKADDERLRSVLAGMAMAALADRPPLDGRPEAQAELSERAGERLFQATTGLTALRSEVGLVEAELDAVVTANAAEETALRTTRSALVDADIYESASRLEEIQNQLQILYSITARTARLNLVSYLR